MENKVTIETVKIQGQSYLLNGTMHVPGNAPGNREYELIKKWLSEGNTPEPEFIDEEIQRQELQIKILEAKLFLDKTDKKVLPDYEFKEGDNSLEWYIEERSKARAFIRANEVI